MGNALSSLAPPTNALERAYIGNPNLRRQGQRAGIGRRTDQLSGPVLAFLSGLSGTAPDEQSGSVLDPTSPRMSPNSANAGFALGTALQLAPLGKMMSLDTKAMDMARRGIEGHMVKQGMIQPATVWHGSPHKFDKFDASKIGTGEGAQAQGHGLYTADNPAVAQQMMGGNIYKVDLPDEQIAKMLDWDKPMSQQTQEVQKIAANLGITDAKNGEDLLWKIKMTRFDAKQAMAANPNKEPHIFAAETLRGAGIPGVRYLDGGSRAGGGTSNYVVFPGEEKMLSILERNGQKVTNGR